MASSSSARSALSALRNTFVASNLASCLATAGFAASRRNVSASAANPASTTRLAAGSSAEMGAAGATVGRHQLVTVELISDTM